MFAFFELFIFTNDRYVLTSFALNGYSPSSDQNRKTEEMQCVKRSTSADAKCN